MILVFGGLAFFAKRPPYLRFYGFFECSVLPPLSCRLLIVRVSPVDRVSQQCDQSRLRNNPRHSPGTMFLFCTRCLSKIPV
jgi:hypothetical protein